MATPNDESSGTVGRQQTALAAAAQIAFLNNIPRQEPNPPGETRLQKAPFARLFTPQRLMLIPLLAALAVFGGTSASFAAGSATNAPAPPANPRSVLEGHPRLAVGPLTVGSTADSGTVVDLVAAELTSSNRFELVERAALDRALREMSLSLAGYTKPAEAIQLGHLLRADLMLVGGPASLKQTNALIARLVDVHTGVILDMTVIPAPQQNLRRTADALAKFASAAGQGQPGAGSTFLAVSTFENLGANRRYPKFSDDLAAAIVASYQGTKVTILERQIIESLFDEMRLSLSGLAEDTGPLPEMKSTFWLVDGFYQSYEKSGPEVELILRVEKMRGGRTTTQLTGQPGPELVSRVKKVIDDALAAPSPALLDVVHRDEVQAQMALGIQRARINVQSLDKGNAHGAMLLLGGTSGPENDQERRQSIQQAMKAFQTVLLLDPANDRAQICLAICLADNLINRLPEARALLREVYDRAKDPATINLAKNALWSTYMLADFTQQTDLLKNYEEAKQLREQIPALRGDIDATIGILADTLMKQGRISVEENLPYALADQRAEVDRQAGQLQAGLPFYGFNFNALLHAYKFDNGATAKAVNEILPSFIQKYPKLRPFLLTAAVRYQVTTNSPVIADFRAAFREANRDPSLPDSPAFFNDASQTAVWARDWRLFDLAAEILEARRVAAESKRAVPLGDADLNVLGTAYIGMARWQEALPIFDSLGRKTANYTEAKAAAELAALCRQKLGLPPPAPDVKPGAPGTFKLGAPALVLPAGSLFTVAGEDLWIVTPSQLHLYLGGSNLTVSVSLRAQLIGPPLCIAAGEGKVWIGTSGEGLLEFDQQTKRISRVTEKDGLLMDSVSALHAHAGRLWIGHARGQVGGVSALDLRTHKITTFVPPLLTDAASGNQISPGPHPNLAALEAAPRLPVMSIAHSDSEEIWFGVWGRGGQHYWPARDKWDTAISEGPVTAVDANSRFEVLGSKGSGLTLRRRSDGKAREFRPDYGEGKGQLPNANATAVALGSDKLWIGGSGYVAVLDIASFRIKRLAHLADTELKDDVDVRQLQLSARDAWILTEKCLYRLPKALAE
jgi:hypothetical protein